MYDEHTAYFYTYILQFIFQHGPYVYKMDHFAYLASINFAELFKSVPRYIILQSYYLLQGAAAADSCAMEFCGHVRGEIVQLPQRVCLSALFGLIC